MSKFIEYFGWYGAVAIITAYFMVSFAVITPTGTLYQVLNATGALGIVLVSLKKKAFQPAFLNIVWLAIAIAAIAKIYSQAP